RARRARLWAVSVGAAPLGDQGTRARKAVRSDLSPPAGLIRTALRPAALEGRDIRSDLPGPRSRRWSSGRVSVWPPQRTVLVLRPHAAALGRRDCPCAQRT